MNDLINRQDAIDVFEILADKMSDEGKTVMAQAVAVMKDLRSAEPKRKKGKWIDGMLYYDFDESEWEKVKCSVCENFVTKQIFYHNNKYHYCPYCGADMRGN